MESLTGSTFGVFLGLTVALTGGAAVMTGQALARTWRPVWQLVFACLGLGLADRFFVYALFDGPLLSLTGYGFDTVVITLMSLAAYRFARTAKLVQQYPWLYERASPWSARRRH
ncbi:MAG: hypothetical protein QF926_01735 [Alphaproteobacteria bacterium]|jgi:hypothetical protein|nr:hypothetical protein [Alphaproteobacteria bacterium]